MFALQCTPTLLSEHWQLTVNQSDLRLLEICDRHYNVKKQKVGKRKLAIGPGESLALMTAELDAAFIWRKERFRLDGQSGVNCAVFRNEGKTLSSLLITEAMQIAGQRWPGERLFTFVNKKAIRSRNPGYCFRKAGWSRCGSTATGLLIFEYMPLS